MVGEQNIVKVNTDIFSIEAVLQAAYVLTEKAYVIIDGDVQTGLIVKLKPKQKGENLTLEFGNELINAQVYLIEAEKEQKISENIVSEALAGLEGQDE